MSFERMNESTQEKSYKCYTSTQNANRPMFIGARRHVQTHDTYIW